MHEVGVGQDVLAVVANPATFVRWGVAVVGCSPQPGYGQRRQARHLVGCQSLGGTQIQGGGAPAGWGGGTIDDVRKHGHEVAKALARGGAGRDDDVGAFMSPVRGLS